ncbi:hypothetical protein MCAP1_001692 [Malassezia caprae]|uniref:Uncharacterized protein n=1 Tax=Malassezia caprae TaxID=1381934 RepID=A0AAF0IW17_9BASI|nr:hypothetical protein MCAP1_001692 [Malassezia caprae]
MDEDGADESFDDPWWDELAIDNETESQLQVAEQTGQRTPAATPQDVPPHALHAQIEELRALQKQQEELIASLTKKNQQQHGEIAVVRANWNRVQQQNLALQHRQSDLEKEYRANLESVQLENRRQMERLETAAAFRRIEQDTHRAAWPSTVRRRAPVMLDHIKKTPDTDALASPAARASLRAPTQGSPLALQRGKRPRLARDENVLPALRSATKREFPHFDNSFLPPSPSPGTGPSAPAGPPSPLRPRRRSSDASLSTPSPEPMPPAVSEKAVDPCTYVLVSVFARQARWFTHVLCHPCQAHESSDLGTPPASVLLHMLVLLLPEHVPASLHEQWRHATEQLWQCVLRGTSYAAFQSECGGMAQLMLGTMPDLSMDPSRAQLNSAVSRVWAAQADRLYGTVAGAIRTMLDILLSAAWPSCLCELLGWVAALSVAHPDFVPYHLKSLRLLCWDEGPGAPTRAGSQTPSSSQASPSTSRASMHKSLVPMLAECVRLTACAAPAAQSRLSEAEQHALRLSAVRVCHMVAWTQAPYGLQDLQPFLKTPGVLLLLLSKPGPSAEVLVETVRLLTLIAGDPLALHLCLSSQWEPAWQQNINPRLSQARFPLIDVLAKHLVDRRNDTPPLESHQVHSTILTFLIYAMRWADASVVLADSPTLLPALIQVLSWDVQILWNSEPAVPSPGLQAAERALERVCQSTQCLHGLFLPEGQPPRPLAERLLAPQVQSVLHGVRHAFVVAIARIAFASEPDWLVLPGLTEPAAVERRHRMRTQLESASALASELIDVVLAPSETDEIYELLADEGD